MAPPPNFRGDNVIINEVVGELSIYAIPGAEPLLEVGQVASAIVVIATAWLLVPKGFTVIQKWKQARTDARVKEATMIAEKVAAAATKEMMDKLMSPNGGKSLYDIGVKLDQVIADNTELKLIQKHTDIRQERLERHLFDVMTPTQRDIAESVGVYSRANQVNHDRG